MISKFNLSRNDYKIMNKQNFYSLIILKNYKTSLYYFTVLQILKYMLIALLFNEVTTQNLLD